MILYGFTSTNMNDNELWDYVLKHKFKMTRPFDRDFIWISKSDFSLIKKFLHREWNFLHSGASYRSANLLLHIHAVEQGDFVFFHKDIGNFRRCILLGAIHLFLDVFPYLVFALWNRQKLSTIFTLRQ